MTHLWDPVHKGNLGTAYSGNKYNSWQEYRERGRGDLRGWSWIPSVKKILNKPEFLDQLEGFHGPLQDEYGETVGTDIPFEILKWLAEDRSRDIYNVIGSNFDQINPGGNVNSSWDAYLLWNDDYLVIDRADYQRQWVDVIHVMERDEPEVKEYLKEAIQKENEELLHPVLKGPNPFLFGAKSGRSLSKYFIPDLVDSILTYL